jgi:predicted sugar kinase
MVNIVAKSCEHAGKLLSEIEELVQQFVFDQVEASMAHFFLDEGESNLESHARSCGRGSNGSYIDLR